MAQKSLPAINKINASMVWYTTFYNKHYRWLSSQQLYFLFFLNKVFLYTQYLTRYTLWVPFEAETLELHAIEGYRVYNYRPKPKERYFKPVTGYVVSINSQLLLLNLYYWTTLERFQELGKKKPNLDKIILKKKIELKLWDEHCALFIKRRRRKKKTKQVAVLQSPY